MVMFPKPVPFVAGAVILLLLHTVQASGQSTVAHHDLAIRLYPKDHLLIGRDTVAVQHGGGRSLVFSLNKGAVVEAVAANGKELAFVFAEEELHIALPPELSGNNEKISLTISYRASFRDPISETPVNTGDPSYGVRGTIQEQGTFLSEGAGWYPEILGSRPTFRLGVEGPPEYEAVTSGNLVRRETSKDASRSEWWTREPLDGLSLSAGPYIVREAHSGKTKLYTYFYKKTDSLSGKYLAAVARYLDLYQGLFGPYPFGKFAVVENFFPTGYGFPSYTLLGSTVVRLPFILDTSLGHEVAHSWWGNGVRVDDRWGNWSEGLTTYVADHLYKERSSAKEGKEYRLKILRDYSTLVSPAEDFPLASFVERDSPASQAVGYGKGAMVFHMARRLAGDDAFWKGLKDVAREKMFREAAWDDFAKAFGRNSGIDFAPFFRQWIDRKGAPVISLLGVRADRAKKGWRVTGKIVQEMPYYTLRVPLRLTEADGSADTLADTLIEISGMEARFAMASATRPLRLIVDPDVDLFRRLDVTEIPPVINRIRGSSNLLVIAARKLPADILQASKILLSGLRKERTNVLHEGEIPPSRLAGHDVLYLGLPERKGYLPPLPRELSLSPKGFAIGETGFHSRGDSLFVALRHPSDRKRVAALFLPLSAEAAAEAAHKIPHYGNYSYVAFSDGTNRAKGTWEAAASPTVHEFPRGPNGESE